MSKLEPAVKRTTLVFAAGLLWTIIGIYLFEKGIRTLLPLDSNIYIMIGIGIFIGIIKSRVVFSKMIDANIERIKTLSPHKEKICIFAFQAHQSYLMVLLMMSFGLLLRNLPIPPQYYGTILIIIGTALFISSLRYFSARSEL